VSRQVSTALILAGGRSRRMGQDKRFLLHEGIPLLWRVIEAARELTRDVRILLSDDDPKVSAALSEPRSSGSGQVQNALTIVARFPDEGPLAALAGALGQAAGQYALVLAADYPMLDGKFLRKFKEALDSAAGVPDVVVPVADGIVQVTCAFYRVAVAGELAAEREGGERSLRRWIERRLSGVERIDQEKWRDWSNPDALFNVNTPGEYQQLERGLNRIKARINRINTD